MGLQVGDRGASEGRPVIGRIGIESLDNIIPRASGQTSTRGAESRESGRGGQQGFVDLGVAESYWRGPASCEG